MQHKINDGEDQASAQKSEEMQRRLLEFLRTLLVQLDHVLDKRLVRTFVHTIIAIVSFRESSKGLLLSELGSYILNPGQAPAGIKRLSNLLRSQRWGYEMIEHFLWQQG